MVASTPVHAYLEYIVKTMVGDDRGMNPVTTLVSIISSYKEINQARDQTSNLLLSSPVCHQLK